MKRCTIKGLNEARYQKLISEFPTWNKERISKLDVTAFRNLTVVDGNMLTVKQARTILDNLKNELNGVS